MGQLHNELRRTPLSRALKNLLGDSKGEGGIERYGETLQPVVDLWSMTEWLFLRQEALLGDSRQVAAGAATTLATYALVNPAGSGMLVKLRSVFVTAPALANIMLRLGTEAQAAALTLIGGGSFKDTRWSVLSPTGVGRALIRTGTPAGTLGVPIHNCQVTANTPLEIPTARLGVILSPGFAAFVQNGDDAATLDSAWEWTERQAQKSELV